MNISSVAGRFAAATTAGYNATKFGVTAFTESLRQEFARRHLRVSVIEPGRVDTELFDHHEGEAEGFTAVVQLDKILPAATDTDDAKALKASLEAQAQQAISQDAFAAYTAALAAMPTWRPLHKPSGQPYHGQQPITFSEAPYLWRPLLSYSRAQLADYAQQHQLTWQEDPSNQQLHWRRNVVRHQLLPAIEDRKSVV